MNFQTECFGKYQMKMKNAKIFTVCAIITAIFYSYSISINGYQESFAVEHLLTVSETEEIEAVTEVYIAESFTEVELKQLADEFKDIGIEIKEFGVELKDELKGLEDELTALEAELKSKLSNITGK